MWLTDLRTKWFIEELLKKLYTLRTSQHFLPCVTSQFPSYEISLYITLSDILYLLEILNNLDSHRTSVLTYRVSWLCLVTLSCFFILNKAFPNTVGIHTKAKTSSSTMTICPSSLPLVTRNFNLSPKSIKSKVAKHTVEVGQWYTLFNL